MFLKVKDASSEIQLKEDVFKNDAAMDVIGHRIYSSYLNGQKRHYEIKFFCYISGEAYNIPRK